MNILNKHDKIIEKQKPHKKGKIFIESVGDYFYTRKCSKVAPMECIEPLPY